MCFRYYFIVFALLIFPSFSDANNEVDSGVDQMQVHTIAEGISLVSRLKIQYDKPRVVVRSYYPILQSTDEEEPPNVALFNQLIAELVQQEIEAFKSNVSGYRSQQEKMNKSSVRNDLVIDNNTSVVKADDDIVISIRFNIEGYIAGTDSPYHYHRVLNYDLDTGEKIELNELFQPDANYLSTLSNYSTQFLLDRLPNREWVIKGAAPSEENYSSWNLKKGGLLITFDNNKVAPQIQGTQTVLIPYSILKDIISPISPISSCVKNSNRCVKMKVVTGGFIDEARASTPKQLLLASKKNS